MKKILITLMCLVLAVGAMSGCGCSYNIEEPTDVATKVPEDFMLPNDESEEMLLPFEGSLDMMFASGVGAWGTNIFLHADGSFTGTYHDSEMGLIGEDYDMTVVESSFYGKFGDFEKISDYAYSMKLKDLKTKESVGVERIEEWGDGTKVRVIYEDAFGIAGGEEFILYLPTAPIKDLPEEFLWWNMAKDEEADKLGRYGLHNLSGEAAFFTYE